MADTSIRLVITAATEDIKKSLEDLRKSFAELGGSLAASGAANTAKVTDGLKKVASATEEANKHAREHHTLLGAIIERSKECGEALNKLAEAAEFVGGGFLAIKAIGLATEFLQVAARTETLGVALHNVGQNAGYTAGQLDIMDKKVQKLGISAEASRSSLIQLIQSGIAVDLAGPLARASQDLAVIAGLDSSETFKRLVTNIQQLDSEGLRFMGVLVDRESVFQRAMQETGHAIDQFAQRQVFANAVLAEAAKLQGTYTSAMETAGKVITSFPRFIEEFKDAVGSAGQGTWTALVFGAKEVIESLTHLAASFKEEGANAEIWGEQAKTLGSNLGPLGEAIRGATEHLVAFIHWLTEHHDAIYAFGALVKDVFLAMAAYAITVFSITSATKLVEFATLMGATVGPAIAAVSARIAAAGTIAEIAAVGFRSLWAALLGPIGLLIIAIPLVDFLVSKFTSSTPRIKENAEAYKSQADAVDHYTNSIKKMMELEQQLFVVTRQIESASFKQATAQTPEDKAQIDKQLESLRARQQALGKQRDELIKDQQRTQKAIDDFGKLPEALEEKLKHSTEAMAKFKEAEAEAVRETQRLINALQQLGSDKSQFGGGADVDLIKNFEAIRQLMRDIGKEGSSAASGINVALRAAEQQISKVHTEADKQSFFQMLDELQARAKELGIDIAAPMDALRQKTRDNVEQAVKDFEAGGATIRAEAFQLARRRAQDLQVQYRTEQQLAAAAQQELLVQEKARYEIGLGSLREFYDNRRTMAADNFQSELKIQQAELQGYLVAVEEAGNRIQRESAQKQVNFSLGRLQVLVAQYHEKIMQMAVEEAQQQMTLQEEVFKTRDRLNTETGYKEQALRDAANRALEEALDKLHGLGGEEAKQLTILEHRVALEAKLSALKSDQLKKVYDQADAELQLQSVHTGRLHETGDISTLDDQLRQNDILQQRIILMEDLRQKLDEQRRQMELAGTYDVDAYNHLADAINGVVSKIENLKMGVKTLGAELQKTFIDSFADHLTNLVNGTEKLREAVKGFFNDLANNITKAIAKDWAETAVKFLNTKFGGDSGGFFDKVMAAVTGKQLGAKVDGSDPTKALWVQMKENTGQGPAEFGGKSKEQILNDAIAANTNATGENTKALVERMRAEAEAAAKASLPKRGIDYSSEPMPAFREGGVGSRPFDFSTAGRGGRPLAIPGFNDEFDRAARANGLDKYGLNGDFLRFQSMRESGMNPNAVGKAGELGLMQVMPATAKEMGYSAEQMKDAAIQIDAGAKYLAQMLQRYGGDLDKALSGYNAGPGATDAAIKKGLPYSPAAEAYVAALGTRGAGGTPKVQVIAVPGEPLEVHMSGSGGATGSFSEGGATGSFGPVYGPPTASGMGLGPGGAVANPANPLLYQNGGNREPATLGNFLGSQALNTGMSALTAIPGVGQAIAIGRLVMQIPKAIEENAKKGFGDAAADVSSGGMGIGQFFDAFGSTIKNYFTNSGSGAGSGGGLGGLLGGLLGGGGSGAVNLGGDSGALMDLFYMADGGLVSGAGGPRDDAVAAYLSNGEYVVNAQTTRKWLPFLHAINENAGMKNMKMPARFADGGLVGDFSGFSGGSSRMGTSPAVKVEMHVHAQDANSFRRSQDQIAAGAAAAANRALRRNGRG